MADQSEIKGAVPHRLFGRRKLTTHYDSVTAANVTEVLESVLMDMSANEYDIETLYQYYRGEQDILRRKKKVRPEICNRAVENHAMEIVSFKTGYIFGEPIQYVSRASKGDTGEAGVSERVAELNELMYAASKASCDKELAEWMFIAGSGFRMLLPDSRSPAGFIIDVLDPRYTALVYTTEPGRYPVMSIQKKRDGDNNVIYWCYTPDTLYKFRETTLESAEAIPYGFIPIFEYAPNPYRIGAFEPVIDLLDALNIAVNSRLDGVEQFIQAFFKGINVKIDEEAWDKLREKGLVLFNSDPGNPAEFDLVSAELNQAQTQVLIDYIYQTILTVCDMPDRNGSNRTTGDTGQAVILRDGWSAAESYARSVVIDFEPVEKRFLAALLRILENTGNDLGLSVADIGIKFTRNMTDNMLTKTQALQNMLEAGIDPRIAISFCSMFSDPEQVYLDSAEYLKKWKPGAMQPEAAVTPANNKPNPNE